MNDMCDAQATKHGGTEYSLRSSADGKINAPSLIEWATNAYFFGQDCSPVVGKIVETWGVPHEAAWMLISRAVPHRDFYDSGRINKVVFEVPS